MFHQLTVWAAANSDWVVIGLLTVVCVVVCSIVFPQDGSGGDFGFGGDCGGE
jgi:preprotein translocase subunit SecG